MSFAEKIAKWIIIGGAILLAFSPFFVTPETAFPAVFLRTVLVRIIIEVMLAAYLFLALFFPVYRPRRSTIAWAVGAFLFIFLLSTIFGINPFRSFWGSHERMEGYVTLLHFGALFLVLFGTFRSPDEFKKLLWASVAVSVAQSFYAFGQIPGIDIEKTRLYANDTARISGTFGNATIFALYILFQLFFAAMLFFWETKPWRKWILAGVTALSLAALYFSSTRGALAGTYLGFFVIFAAAVLWGKNKLAKKIGVSVLAAGLVLFGTLVYFRNAPAIRDNWLLRRALVVSEIPESRLTAWKIGLDAWKQRFWLGYGMENFNYAFNRFYNPKMLSLDQGDFDRAHNRFVDTFVTGGFLGLAAYLAVFAAAAVFLIRKWLSSKAFLFPVACLALLAAYPVQLMLLFDHMISYQMFAIFLAFLAVWEAGGGQKAKGERRNGAHAEVAVSRSPLAFSRAAKVAAVLASAIGMGVFAWQANIKPVEASYWAQVATNTHYVSQGQRFGEAFEALKRSFGLDTYLNVDMRLALHSFALSYAQSLQGEENAKLKKEVLEYLAGQFDKNLTEHHPDIKDFLAHTSYARIASALAEFDPAWNEKAVEVLEAGVEEYPAKFQLFQTLGRLYAQLGRYDEALAVYERSPWEYAPDALRFEYAATLLSAGRSDKGRDIVRELAGRGTFDFGRNLGRLVDFFIKEQDLGTVALLYENQLALDPDNTQLLASLAETYRQGGDIANARRVAEILLVKDPEHRQETEAFLRELEANP